MSHLAKFFDRLEDVIRGWLSRFPIFYALLCGAAIVLFWRGVWHTADLIELGGFGWWWSFLFSAPVSLVTSVLFLLITGVFVSFFIGEKIILSGLKHEKKIEEKTEKEVREEGAVLAEIYGKLEHIEKEIKEIKEKI